MPSKLFSLVSWNVEHFRNDRARIDRVVAFLAAQQPDVLGLYEVEGASVFAAMKQALPGYQFHITEGPQTQEILVGVKSGFSAFFTQRLEFKSGDTYLRPGALLTLTVNGADYPILFLHTKSSDKPIGLGIRDDQFERAIDFRKTLDKKTKAAGQGRANFIFLGDLNTMGMSYPFSQSVSADTELKKLDRDIKKVAMRRLAKNQPFSWSNGSASKLPPSNLDQVVAADHLQFQDFGGAPIDVRGWPVLTTTAEQDAWIKAYSDHALLYMEVLG